MRTITLDLDPGTLLRRAWALLKTNGVYGNDFWPGAAACAPWSPGEPLDPTAAIAAALDEIQPGRGWLEPINILEDVAGISSHTHLCARPHPAFQALMDHYGFDQPGQVWHHVEDAVDAGRGHVILDDLRICADANTAPPVDSHQSTRVVSQP